jgi:hypothetical protein
METASVTAILRKGSTIAVAVSLAYFVSAPVACGSSDASQQGLDPTRGDPSAPGAGDSGLAGTGGPSFGTGEGGASSGETDCAHVEATLQRIVPNVWLMIDGSASMVAPLQAGASRFEELRTSLVDATAGLVSALQDQVAFGLYLYDGCAPGFPGAGCFAGACPRAATVDPALHNFSAIAARYPAAPPGASTPTDVALAALGQRIGSNASTPNRPPTYVILATDGEPNLCDWHDGIPSNDLFKANSLTAVQAMVASGTKVFAVSLAGGDAALQAYLASIAAAGGTGKPAFTPTTKDDLVQALTSILGNAVSCEVQVTGEVTAGKECMGEVTLNGKPVACNDANGWRLKDSKSIELLGASCDALRSAPTATLKATFPCDAYQSPR